MALLVSKLVAFGLRQVLGDSADNIAAAIDKRFSDHSRGLPRALARAHERAWQTLGVALAGDGLLDIFVTGGGYFDGPDKKQIKGCSCRLYHNDGNWRFTDVTAAAGLDRIDFYNHGCAVADYDRDGWPDLLVTGWGRLALFHNVPADPHDPAKGRRFEDVTAAAGLDKGITWASSAAFGDLDGDGYPDLYVCQYVNWSWSNHRPCLYDGKTPDVCTPAGFSGLTHKVYRNNGDGTFTDVAKAAGVEDVGAGMSVSCLDYNRDGRQDLYVADMWTAAGLRKPCVSQPLAS